LVNESGRVQLGRCRCRRLCGHGGARNARQLGSARPGAGKPRGASKRNRSRWDFALRDYGLSGKQGLMPEKKGSLRGSCREANGPRGDPFRRCSRSAEGRFVSLSQRSAGCLEIGVRRPTRDPERERRRSRSCCTKPKAASFERFKQGRYIRTGHKDPPSGCSS